jgi:DNA-binding HxlR family transcriptional regulator
VTRDKKAAPGLWYEDACGAAHGLELVGERWSLLVVRELLLGPRRFGQLRDALPGVSANILTQRLESLEQSGIVVRRELPASGNAHVYELTPWGYEAEPILQTLGRWAARSPAHDPSLPLSAVSLLLSFRTMLDAKQAKGIDCRAALQLGPEPFALHVSEQGIEIERGASKAPDFALSAEPAALASVVYGNRALGDAEAAGDVRLTGDRALAKRFLKLFRLPPPACSEGSR